MSDADQIVQLPPNAERRRPWRTPVIPAASYCEFAVASNFSFLHGASSPEELVGQADHLGLAGLGLCDRNSVAGVVRAHLAKRENNLSLRYHPGARLIFADGAPDILAYPRDRKGWGRLCRLLTKGNLRAEKGACILHLQDLIEHVEGLELIVMDRCTSSSPSTRPQRMQTPALRAQQLSRLHEAAPGRVRLAASILYRGNDRSRLLRDEAIAQSAGIPLLAVNDVLYHHYDRRSLQDVLTCIREHMTIDAAGRRLAVNAERYLKPPEEMARLFRAQPRAIEETVALSQALTFSLDELKYEYPHETREGFATPQDALVHHTWQGAAVRYPHGIPAEVKKTLNDELALIARLNYAPFFLTVHDIVRYARSQGILCQGRGSAANSAVCYCLHVTEVNPAETQLLFERFVSEDRREPPDIDVDFEHERREEVIQYIYKKYTRERAGIAATVISYRGRSAIREVGKVFGLSEDMIGALSSSIWGGGGGSVRVDALRNAGLDPDSTRVQKIIALAQEIQGFPRHLSQHVGGFVITQGRLDEAVPIGNGAMPDRTFIEWDKDDIDALGMLKVDVLGLGMLTCIRKAFHFIERHYPAWYAQARLTQRALTLDTVPKADSTVYDMLCRADSLGVFQVESRAQMTMLPRLRPREFYDLVIEVAIVRPGPIQGDMVHPYLRRRQKLRETGEEPNYPSPVPGFGHKDELRNVLSKTLGVPLFQEQAMKIAIVAGGFTPGEADKLRRAMATFKRTGTIGSFRHKMVEGMVRKGYAREFAERCFSQIEGFGEYGFPESHAASFALLVYASAWIKCHYPDAFAAALLNSQPMGFYAPAQIVRDAREHGVDARPVDINFSDYDATLEPGPPAAERLHNLHKTMRQDIHTTHALRLGLRAISGLREEEARHIVKRRRSDPHSNLPPDSRREIAGTAVSPPLKRGRSDREAVREGISASYTSIRDVWLRTGLSVRTLERLADADAFGSLGLTRRQALWAVKALGRAGDQDDLPLLALSSPLEGEEERDSSAREPHVVLPQMSLGEEVVNDYRFTHLSLKAHPASFLRDDLRRQRVLPNDTLRIRASGERVKVSGLITVRQRPGSAQGVIFMTIEDETGTANIIVWPNVFERFRPIVLGARYIAVSGPLQKESDVIHVVANSMHDLTPLLARLTQDLPPVEALARADAVKHPHAEDRPQPRIPGKIPLLSNKAAIALAADLDAPARGSAHSPNRRGR